MGSFSEKDEKHTHGISVANKEVDTGAQLVAGGDVELDEAEATRIRRKIDMHILPLMCVLYWIQFMDKTTLGSAAILGIETWLCNVFLLEKWMSFNISVWAVALCAHAACKNFAGLFVVRLILGACEGSITAGFLIVTSMFYTRTEQTVRVGYWFLMNGTAQIITGFVAFGSLHIKTKGFEPWQWLMIITGIMTLIVAICFFLFFPDSPTNAWFLTPDERAKAVQRIKVGFFYLFRAPFIEHPCVTLQVNQTGVENKTFKKEQLIEALLDPKTWLFALFSALDNIPNSLTNQRSLIVASFGFTPLQTTLLGCVDGAVEIITIFTGVKLVARIPNSRAYVGILYYIPNILGCFLINFLPWSDKIGLLFGIWLTGAQPYHMFQRACGADERGAGVGTTGFVLALAWVSATTAGHTKKVTVNAIMLGAYCVGNAAAPFMWQQKYKPRNHVPWIIIGVSYIVCMALLFIIRVRLDRENKRRDAEPADETYDDVYVLRRTDDGVEEELKVAKEFLDLTDKQNRDFRYVL
ncbi:hypothetical protein EWM64_g8770 [Hericium alpestre]|uniref:Major facilitator superfamily (MFS) profile domain-containing protein n=1 Tax=Hericium alpestre TaxID=135208 RepID=A0A4Y9ZKH6_9AGAM|nr:hypothetical protein EWM64_g8770 [Hericium alpestre]